MPAQQYSIKIRGPFKALECVEQALNRCELVFKDPISSVSDITSIPNAKQVALQVEFASGLKVKLVVGASVQWSFNDFAQWLELLPRANVPQVLVVDEQWAAFEWIEGPTLRQHGLNDSLLHEAARFLSKIHSLKTPVPSHGCKEVLSWVHRKLKQKLPVLVWNDIISEEEHDEILNLSRSMSNKTFEISLIHGDFSPDNLVIRGTELWSVDNEKLTGHASDYDLCRAVNLWDEWNSSGTALLNAYNECSGQGIARESLFFWEAFDLVYRISYRISLGEFNEFCISRLRQTLATSEFR